MKHFISALFFPLLLSWVSLAYGKTAIAWQTQSLSDIFAQSTVSSITDYYVLQPKNDYQVFKRRYTPYRLTALLRFQQSAGLVQTRSNLSQPDSLPQTSHTPYFLSIRMAVIPPPSLAPILNRVRLFSPQPSRLGGWKESNTQYIKAS